MQSSPALPLNTGFALTSIKVREFDGTLLRTSQLIAARRNQYIAVPLIGLIGLSARPLIKKALGGWVFARNNLALRNTTFRRDLECSAESIFSIPNIPIPSTIQLNDISTRPRRRPQNLTVDVDGVVTSANTTHRQSSLSTTLVIDSFMRP
ncbi:hypothetical protein N431DRAFT_461485 [Stipitochalara longipes BDJ]|nr:hypothetical protein N431DRAFT_461485 [Stipitochalara longipes BDJ]